MECTLCRFCDNPRFPHTSCRKSDNSHPQRKRPPIRNPNGTAGHRPGKPRFLRPETALHYTRRIFRQQTHVQHTGRKGLYLWHILLYRSHAIRKLFNHIDPNRNRIHPTAHRRSLRRNRSTQKRARPDRRVHHRTNYLRGDMARTLDSPFSIADYYLSLKANDLPVEYFAQQDEAIRQLSPGDLLSAAQKYLVPSQFYIAVAGDKNKIPPLSLP